MAIVQNVTYMLPVKTDNYIDLRSSTTKLIREGVVESNLINLKLFQNATASEIKAWSLKIKKLTSTRHKNFSYDNCSWGYLFK